MEVTMYPCPLERVLAAAIIAQDINGEYLSDKSFSPEGKVANKLLMKELIKNQDPRIDWRLTHSQNIIAYCQTKMIELMAGSLTPYWQSILRVTNKAEIAEKDHLDFGIIASLPAAYERSVARDVALAAKEAAQANSNHFGKVGDRYSNNATVISQIHSVMYNRTWFTAVDQDQNLINFPHSSKLEIGKTYYFKGKIRKHGNDNTTMLHYVTAADQNTG
jgi:hypothetical protein